MQPRSGSLRRWLSRWLAMLTFLGLGGYAWRCTTPPT